MNSDLKRDQFSSQIRQRQRDKFRQQIRIKFINQHQTYKFTSKINKQQLIQLKRKCRQQNYGQNCVVNLINLLKGGIVGELAQDGIIKILSQILINFEETNYRYQWQYGAKNQIKEIIKNIIKQQLSFQKDNEWKKQVGDLVILKNCFTYLIQAIINIPQLVDFVNYLTSVQNQQLFRIVSKQFIVNIIIKSNQNIQIPIQQYLLNLQKISRFCHYLPYEDNESIIRFITIVENSYQFINNTQQTLIVKIMINLLTMDIKRKMNYVINQTNLIQKLFMLLQTNTISQEIQTDLIYLVAKMFCAADEQIYHIYQRCKNIIQILRQRLPLPNIPQKTIMSSAHKLTHKKTCLTRNTLFALSNIIASGLQFAQICLQSDIFRALKILYQLQNRQCRMQIIVCFFNMLNVISYQYVQVILQQNFIDIIGMILDEQDIIDQINGLRIVLQIMDILQNQARQQTFSMITRKQFQVKLIEKGIKTKIQGLITSQNKQACDKACKIIESMSSQNI